jgi:hypothetical protein
MPRHPSKAPLAAVLAPVRPLFLAPADSDLGAFLAEAWTLIHGYPALTLAVDHDLDRHALAKKERRLADAAWLAARSGSIPGLEPEPPRSAERPPGPPPLKDGRPRTPGAVVLLAVLLRGYLGSGFKACAATTLMFESVSIQVMLTNLGLKMPGRSTLTELVNAVSNETRLRVLDAQIAQALHLGLDTFDTMLQDSTHVAGNTAWPTDSGLLLGLAARLLRVGGQLERLSLPKIECPKAAAALEAMARRNREIALVRGKKDSARVRRRAYRRLLTQAKRLARLLARAFRTVKTALAKLDVCPSRKAMAERAVARLQGDLDALDRTIDNCESRVLKDRPVPMADKVLSLSDRGAGFIAKGQRDPVVGYKPQLARSGRGFITGLILPRGNAADSGQLQPMYDPVVQRTGVRPRAVSVDDGYASHANVEALRAHGCPVISLSGAKGHALTAAEDWDREEYRTARGLRSAVESLMYTLQQGYDFGVMARRGLPAVTAEVIEKALAYNVCRTADLRRSATSCHDRPPDSTLEAA